jgi:hypothetical protein
VIDSTGLKVFGEGEWKVKNTAKNAVVYGESCIWQLTKTHEIICADLSLNNVTDSEAFPGLIRQTHREKIRAASADGVTTPGSVTMNCGVRKSAPLSVPEKVRVTGPVNMQTVTVQWLISE